MASVNLKSLVGRANGLCRRTLESAAGLCLSRSNYNVEIEHWLTKLLEEGRTDVASILAAYEVDSSRLGAELTKALDRFKTGNSRAPSLSPQIVDLLQQAWLIASIEFGEGAVRSGHLLVAMLRDETLRGAILSSCPSLGAVSPEGLQKDFATLTDGSEEAGSARTLGEGAAAATGAGGAAPGGKPGRTPNLDQYTINLTARAKAGELDPVLGRDAEIRQLADILTRRRQNNPILTGEAGVGKTAVVEGFAQRIADGDVPPSLQNVDVHVLDLGLLQAGAGVKGEFENRLKGVIEEVKSSPTPIIMFIDEAHTMIGAGGQAGQGDAANLLKPALARGELRTIAATTWAEYKKYFEKDAALTRRFQVVKVEEPEEEIAVAMMRGLAETLEKHHNVRILNDAVIDAVRLSKRYIAGRQLPDKSVSLLDTACARIGISQSSSPPRVEDARRRIDMLETAKRAMEREQAAGGDLADKLEEIDANLTGVRAELEELEQRWNQEQELVKELLELRGKLEGAAEAKPEEKEAAEAEAEKLRGEMETKLAALRELQGESPLVHYCVDSQAVAETVSAWTGIPLGRMVANEVNTVLKLKELMEEAIIGQSHALDAIAQRIRTSRAGLSDPRMPIGVFLLAGTSGVGKTETAITLANLLYGGEQNMTVINMSEFKEEHKVSLLMGSPPGYVGYGEGGVLTEAVRRKPYSVVLLDEMEKAHPGVQDIFYQVFDKGSMKDGEGRDIDFRNTVILMTTNAGTDLMKSLCADPEMTPEPEAFSKAVFPELLKTFKPAFLGRLSIVPYYPLPPDVLRSIVHLKLGKIQRRIHENYQAGFEYTPELVEAVVERCTETDTGARNIDHILTGSLLPELSEEFLTRLAAQEPIQSAQASVGDDGKFVFRLS